MMHRAFQIIASKVKAVLCIFQIHSFHWPHSDNTQHFVKFRAAFDFPPPYNFHIFQISFKLFSVCLWSPSSFKLQFSLCLSMMTRPLSILGADYISCFMLLLWSHILSCKTSDFAFPCIFYIFYTLVLKEKRNKTMNWSPV